MMPDEIDTNEDGAARPSNVALASVSILLVALHFPRGTFLLDEYRVVMTFVLLGAAGYLLLFRVRPFVRIGVELTGFSLLLSAYVLALVRRPYELESWYGPLWVAASFGVFVVARQAAQRPAYALAVGHAVMASGVVLAFLGLLAGAGVVPEGTLVATDGLCSTFGYANTFAAYMLLATMAAVGSRESSCRIRAAVYESIAMLGVLSIGAARSRFVMMLLPILVLAHVATSGSRAGNRLRLIFVLAVGFVLGVWIAPDLADGVRPAVRVIPKTLLGFALVLSANVLKPHADRTPSFLAGGSSSFRRWRWPCLGFAGASIVLMFAFRPPFDISPWFDLHNQAVLRRVTAYGDGLRMIIANPLGLGYHGWGGHYQQYQSFGYTLGDPHSMLVRFGVEGGAAALAGLGMLASVVVLGLRRLARMPDGGVDPFRSAVLWGLAGLLIHAMVDVDMSFGVVWFTFLAFLPLARVGHDLEHPERRPAKGSWLAAGFAVAALAASTVLWYDVQIDQARRYGVQGRSDRVRATCERLIRLGPRIAPPHYLLGSYSREGGSGTGHLAEAARMSPENYEYQRRWARALISDGEVQAAETPIRTLTELKPWRVEAYEDRAMLLGRAAETRLAAGDTSDARRIIREIESVRRDLAARHESDDVPWRLWNKYRTPASSTEIDEVLSYYRAIGLNI